MKRALSEHPVLLVHPENTETEYLRNGLSAAGVTRPFITFTDLVSARDYLDAALLVDPVQTRFLPCVVLLDEKLGEHDLREFTRWMQSHSRLAKVHLVVLSDNDAATTARRKRWGTAATIATAGQLSVIASVITESCR